MAYITKQKFNIRELVGSLPPTKTILLVINEENLREIYRRQLIEHNFQVNTAVFADVVAMARYLNSADLLIVELANTSDEKLNFKDYYQRFFEFARNHRGTYYKRQHLRKGHEFRGGEPFRQKIFPARGFSP